MHHLIPQTTRFCNHSRCLVQVIGLETSANIYNSTLRHADNAECRNLTMTIVFTGNRQHQITMADIII